MFLSTILINKSLFYFLIFFNIIFIILSIYYYNNFIYDLPIFNKKKKNFTFHEHFSLEHRGLKHYTLPKSNLKEFNNISLYNLSKSFNFLNNSRSIVNCSHFLSEITCSDFLNAFNLINKTEKSKKFLYVELPKKFEEAIETLHFSFVLSIISLRRLFIINNKFHLSKNFEPKKILKSKKFFSNKISFCNTYELINSKENHIYLKGFWHISRLLLSSKISEKIPIPFNTHGLYLLSRKYFYIKPIKFPSNQLQIGLLIQFSPNITKLIINIQKLSEGYQNYSIHLFSTIKINLPKSLKNNIKIYFNLKDSFDILIQCDKFIGSLGFFESHWINANRGKGGFWFDPRDTNIIETSSSQSGLLFRMKNSNPYDLMCPKSYNSFQKFMLFNAI